MAPPVADERRFGCSYCAKSFARHEHQKRHELTVHTASRPHRCSFCSKEFVRKDALQRHESTHQASSPSLLQLGARACNLCASARVKCSGEVQCKRCSQRNLLCTYPGHTARGAEMQSQPGDQTEATSIDTAVQAVCSNNTITNMQFEPDLWDPTCMASTNWLDTIDLDGFDVLPNYDFTSQEGQQTVGISSSLVRNALDDHGETSPALTSTTAGKSDSVERSTEAGEYYVDGEASRLPRTKRRKTSALPAPARDVNAPFSLRVPRETETPTEMIVPLDGEAYDRLSLAYQEYCLACPPLWCAFETAEFPSRVFFEGLLGLFRQNFSQTLPFLHESSFNGHAIFHWSLVAAMAAIGSHYIDSHYNHGFAVSMHEFVNRIWQVQENSLESENSMALSERAQVLLLHAVGSAYCGSPRVTRYLPSLQQKLSESFELVAHLYPNLPGTVPGAVTSQLHRQPSTSESPGNGLRHYKAFQDWRRKESTIRLAYSIWLVDSMLAYHFQRSPLLSLCDADLPLPCHEKLWLSTDANDWKLELPDHPQDLPTLPRALQELYIDKRLPRDRGEYARILIIHGLFRRSWEVERYYSDPLSLWEPVAQRENSKNVIPVGGIWLPSIPAFARWQNTACDSLDILHWQANATIGQASGLEHPTVLHLHAARIVLLVPYTEIVAFAKKMASAGSSGSGSRQTSTELFGSPAATTIRNWAVRHQYKARLAVIHAGVVFWHVRRYATDAFYEAPAVALAALTLWAFGLFGVTQSTRSVPRESTITQPGMVTQLPPNDIHSTVFVPDDANDEDMEDSCDIILLDRPTDDELVQHFIRDGHKMQAHLSGVGDLYRPDGPRLVLKQGCRLLSSSGKCWAVAFEWLRLLEELGQVTGRRVGADEKS